VEITWSIVLAAGSGSRFGGNKQNAMLGHRRVVEWSVAAAGSCCDGVVLVANPETVNDAVTADAEIVVAGGRSRSQSVRKGLEAVPPEATIIVVHDAARPGASTNLYRAVIEAVKAGADAAVPALPVVDTLKRVVETPNGIKVKETVDRADLMAIQTPQAFKRQILEAAHESGDEATDDAGLVEAVGGSVNIIPGELAAIKITTPQDLDIAAELMGLIS
jgi:2-C-methyl-D-erythritol 4-phosphate cytidylyltransferase